MLVTKLNNTSIKSSFKGISLSDSENNPTSIRKLRTSSNYQKSDRANLPDNCDVVILYGPKEKEEAKLVVFEFSTFASGIAAAMAQEPGVDELALAANEATMALAIGGIYNLKLSENVWKSIMTAIKGHVGGLFLFRMLSKSATWIPGPGNALNAGVAGTTTALLGAELIKTCEEIEKRQKRGEDMDKIIEAIKKAKKKK